MRKRTLNISVAFTLILLLCLSSVPTWAATVTPAVPEQIVLSLTGDASEMAVTWCEADNTSNAAVTYSVNPDLSGAQSATANESVSVSGLKYYDAIMTGLESGKTYYYSVGTALKMSGVKSFTTGDGANDYDFIYLGDVQFNNGSMESEYSTWNNLVKSAYTDNPSTAFFMQGGDFVNYGQNPEEWQSLLTKGESTFSKVPLLSVPGNHESNAASGKPELYSEIFDLPKNGPSGFEEEFYSFDYGDSHIICLNSNIYSDEQLDAGTMTESQFDTIKEWIADDLSSSTKTWNIVVLHHPPYVVVDDTISADVLNEWVPIFEDNGVNLVLCGHQHIYMRTYPMFDREISTTNGITYVMGDSGSKFYDESSVDYDASMIADTSTYQKVSVESGGVTVTTYNASGTVLDSTVVTEPTTTGNAISLSYNTSVAAVTAPANATSGTAVTVNISNIASGKNVYGVTVKDKNGKSYSVTTLTANSSYSFTMPNRSVTAEVVFEDSSSGGSTGTYYTYTLDTGDDPIWTLAAASSGISADDSTKIKEGSTVTVSVSRDTEALSASLIGLSVMSGSTVVPITTVSTTKGLYGKIKGGKYQFTMPAGDITISPEVDYEGLKVYARSGTSDSYSLKDTLSRDDMVSLADTGDHYTGYDQYPTAVVGKADEYVGLKELLKSCKIELTSFSNIVLTAIDGATATFTYDELFGTTRYYYPNISSGSSAGKTAIDPMLVIKGYQSRYINLPSGQTIDDMTPDTLAAYRFAFGQTTAQFNNGKASSTYATVADFLKWTNSIKVTGYTEITDEEEEEAVSGGGGGVAVEAEAVVDTSGKATIRLEEAAVKESLATALEAAKTGTAIPELKINVPMEDGMKSVEVSIPKAIMKELSAQEKLKLTISTPFGSTTLDTETLKAIQKTNADKEVKIAIIPVDGSVAQNLDGRELTGDVVSITITAGGNKITKFGDGKIAIQIPFTPDPAKKSNGYYVVWLTENGKAKRMNGSLYNSAAGAMTFETQHLSNFGVAYTTNTAVNVFNDVKEDAWYAPFASFVTEKGYFQGTTATTFGPDTAMTRAMLVTVLGRINSVNTQEFATSNFSDVDSASWYGGYVQWAYQNGIVNGVGNEKFAPNQPITREQLAAILANYYEWKNKTAGMKADSISGSNTSGASVVQTGYGDADQIANWADAGVTLCASKGWIAGYPDGNFKPDKSASRAEVAKMLNCICE